LTDQRVVFHHQDGFAAALGVAAALDDGVGGRKADRMRQIQLHRRAMADFAVDLDVAVRLFDEAVDHT